MPTITNLVNNSDLVGIASDLVGIASDLVGIAHPTRSRIWWASPTLRAWVREKIAEQ